MNVGFRHLQIAKERVGHRGIVMLSGMDRDGLKVAAAALHRRHERRYFYEVGTRAGDEDDLEHKKLSAFSCQRSAFAWLIADSLQPNYPGPALAPQISIERVARVHDQHSLLSDSGIIDLAVIRDDDDAIGGLNVLIVEFDGSQRRSAAFGVRIVKAQLAHEWIVVTHVAAFAAQTI